MNNVSHLSTTFQILAADKGHLENLGESALEKKNLIYAGILMSKTKRANDLSVSRKRIRRNTPNA